MRWWQTWPDLSLRSKCMLLISFPAAATVVMFGVANVLGARNSAATELVNRAQRSGQQIQRLRAAETEASADVRAYYITAQESFVSRTRYALADFDSARQQLVNLSADNMIDQQRLSRIASIEHVREERMFGDIARFRLGLLPASQLRDDLQAVEAGRSQMAVLLKGMEQDNARQVEALLQRVDATRAEQSAITSLCLFFGLLGGVAMTLLFTRGITSRIDRLQRNLARLPGGAIPEPLAGRDEIGALNEGLIQAADALRHKSVALENAPYGIAEVNADGGYLWMNPTYGIMAGCSPAYRPAGIVSTVQPEDRPRVQEAIANMRLNGRAEIAARFDQPQGSLHGAMSDVAMTFLAAAGDADTSFYVFLRDMWAGKKADAALIRAKDAAEASNRAKTEFLAKISHDIRTPLNAILGSADLLSQTPLSFDQGEYVNMFQRNCRRLVALINDFLDFSRIEAGAVRLERAPFQIRVTVDDAVATFREAAGRKAITLGVEIDPAVPAWALGDPLRIQQVLVNLLSNALKFTACGRVDVNVKVLSAASARRQASIRGVRHRSRHPAGGSRQNLRAVRAITQSDPRPARHRFGPDHLPRSGGIDGRGGRRGQPGRRGEHLSFQPAPSGGGARSRRAGPRRERACPASSAHETMRILVAEDTEDNRLLLEHYLRDQPVTVRFALNGQEALDAVQQGEPFDLILMDIDMPVMDGYTATRRIRAWQQANGTPGKNPATPIVALSADAMREAVRASLDAGCVAHVAKPLDRGTLLKTIRRYAPAPGGRGALLPGTIPVSEQVMALVPQYLASKEKQIEEARSALASRDFGPIRRFGHNLKGTGRGYGFPPIEELGREIERAAAQGDPNRIVEQLDALHRFVNESAAALADS